MGGAVRIFALNSDTQFLRFFYEALTRLLASECYYLVHKFKMARMEMKTSLSFIIFASLSTALLIPAHAGGPGTSGGMTLMESAAARPMSLGEAFSASMDDISGFAYNPSSLGSLKSSQASFVYRSGMADDSFGQFMIGSPLKSGGLGLSVGYFNGGKIDLFDGENQRRVTVQKDIAIALGYAFHLGLLNLGVSGKYLSSNLAEEKTATAYAADAGFQLPLNSRVQFGSSVQNIGTKLKFNEEGDNLPRLARSGISVLIIPGRSAVRFMIDGVCDLNESKIYPAVGLETSFGPLSLRAGYKGNNGLNQFSFGTGIAISRYSFDYSFGMVDRLDSMHMASISMKFGSSKEKDELSQRKTNAETVLTNNWRMEAQ